MIRQYILTLNLDESNRSFIKFGSWINFCLKKA